MRTTIDVPDDLFQRAKIAAAQRKITLKELVLQGLEYATRTGPQEEEAARQQRVNKLLIALQASNNEPLRPLSREEIHATREELRLE